MALQMSLEIKKSLPLLRFEPTARRVRADSAGRTVVDSNRALLVWEARRLTPVFAVPADDIAAELVPCTDSQERQEAGFRLEAGGASLMDPRTRFRRHTCDGEEFTVRVQGNELVGAAFRPADPDLAGHVLLDFAAFDRWREEEQVIEGHPRDPFHRVDARASSRKARAEYADVVLADSSTPVFVYETMLPVRAYFSRAAVNWDRLVPSDLQTVCPYKGRASYWSVPGDDPAGKDIAWSYEQTLPDAEQLAGLVAFYDERANVFVDGDLTKPGTTPWSKLP